MSVIIWSIANTRNPIINPQNLNNFRFLCLKVYFNNERPDFIIMNAFPCYNCLL